LHSLVSLLGGQVLPPRPGVVHPVAPAGITRGDDRISQVPGEPNVRSHMFFDSGRTACTRPIRSSSMALDMTNTKAPTTGCFRSSIAWPSDSLFTLRRTGHPATTQNSLPAVGQTLLDGIPTRRVPSKGFKAVSLHAHPPFPSFLTQCHARRVYETKPTRLAASAATVAGQADDADDG
jgi:hypothetical protein